MIFFIIIYCIQYIIYPGGHILSDGIHSVWLIWKQSWIVVTSYITGPGPVSKIQFNPKIIIVSCLTKEQRQSWSCSKKLSGNLAQDEWLPVCPAERLAGSARTRQQQQQPKRSDALITVWTATLLHHLLSATLSLCSPQSAGWDSEPNLTLYCFLNYNLVLWPGSTYKKTHNDHKCHHEKNTHNPSA